MTISIFGQAERLEGDQAIYITDLRGGIIHRETIGIDHGHIQSLSLCHDNEQILVNGDLEWIYGILSTIGSINNDFILSPFWIIEEDYKIINYFSELLESNHIIKNLIQHASIDPQTGQIINSVIKFGKSKNLINDIRGMAGQQPLNSNIDTILREIQGLVNEIVRHGYGSEHILRSAIEIRTGLIEQSIRVEIGGSYIKGIISGNLGLYSDEQNLSDMTLEIASKEFNHDGELEITINDNSIGIFILEERENKGNRVSVWGRASTTRTHELKENYRFINTLASHIAQSALQGTGIGLNWQIDDWLIPAIDFYGTPLELITQIAGAAGGIVRATPDGIIHVCYPLSYASVEELRDILEMKVRKEKRTADGVKIIYGMEVKDRDQNLRHAIGSQMPFMMSVNKTELEVGEWAEIRIYAPGNYEITTTADRLILDQRGIEEIVEEEFIFNNPEIKMLSYPAHELIEFSACEGVRIEGHYLISDVQCALARVKYRTGYDLWKATSLSEKTDIICTARAENIYLLVDGNGKRIDTIEDPLITGPLLAKRRAEYELWKRKDKRIASIIVPYQEELINYQGLHVSTPEGDGVVIGESIKFEANPLKILIDMEVALDG